jgi:hypothetical protein
MFELPPSFSKIFPVESEVGKSSTRLAEKKPSEVFSAELAIAPFANPCF